MSSGDSDPDGRAAALVDVIDVRTWREADLDAACATNWVNGYWAWVLENVRPIRETSQVAAERRLYRVVPPRSAALLGVSDAC